MISIAFSPCPNDTFIFDALVNHKIDTQGLQFDVYLEDVETLNIWALQNKHDVTKISYGTYPLLLKNYTLLNSGGALGKGVGPLLITNNSWHLNDSLQDFVVAIPGKNTTAHLLFSLAYPMVTNKVFMPFNEIENWLLINNNLPKKAGVIIHENRFTYLQKGLMKIVDLGNFWEQTTNLPIPLGGIVASKKLDTTIVATIDSLIRKSIEFAFANDNTLPNFITQNAQEMSQDVMRQHIDLYVNNFSLHLGIDGQNAVNKILEIYASFHK
jgi:1,4-dihydroxy-6-naphthoate synthase